MGVWYSNTVMKLSVVIPVKNERANIAACMHAFDAAQREGWLEILVVDNASTDNTVELAREAGATVFHQGPERSAQRNRGWREATGDFILFVDADMRVPSATLDEIRRALDSNQWDAMYIREIRVGSGWWIRVRNFERSFYDTTCIDGLRVIRRDLLVACGGYDETMYAAEDWDLDRRILAQTSRVMLTQGHLLHDEGQFSFARHLRKKAYYSGNVSVYLAKWGWDEISRKQFGLGYRFFGVFVEHGKWRRVLRYPHYMVAIWFERLCVGLLYLKRKYAS